MLASEQTARRAGSDFSQQGQALDKRHHTEWIKYSDCQTLTERRKYNNSAKVTLFKLYKPANIFFLICAVSDFAQTPISSDNKISMIDRWYDMMRTLGSLKKKRKKRKTMNRVKSMYSSWLWLVTKQHNTKGTSCSFLNLKLKKKKKNTFLSKIALWFPSKTFMRLSNGWT